MGKKIRRVKSDPSPCRYCGGDFTKEIFCQCDSLELTNWRPDFIDFYGVKVPYKIFEHSEEIKWDQR